MSSSDIQPSPQEPRRPAAPPGAPRSFFYGWVIVLAAPVCYGFAISPAYYSWGFVQPEMIPDLGFTREQVGLVFGLFVLAYSFMSLGSGIAISKFGVRGTIIIGTLISTGGFLYLSRADSVSDCYIGFSLLVGVGVGLSSIIPAQTLASNWFVKYRARAMGFILAGGGVVGMAMPTINRWIMARGTWQTVWVALAGISFGVAALAAFFVRNRPEDMGQLQDGAVRADGAAAAGERGSSGSQAKVVAGSTPAAELWTARQAMRTKQFFMITFCGVAYAAPYSTLMPHIRLHLDGLGYSIKDAAWLVGLVPFVSIFGRFSGGLGDFVKPHVLFALALALEGAGLAGISSFESKTALSISLALVALGFGMGYVCTPVLFSNFFGRDAFATSSGTRISISGIFNALGPILAGSVFDRWQTYDPAFLVLVGICAAGVLCALLLSPPGPPPNSHRTQGT